MTRWTPDISSYEGHRYRALAEAIRDAILSGELKPETKLLAHREMSWRVGVTVGTVAKSYKLLSDWGLVYARIGDGTWVKSEEQQGDRLVIGEKKIRNIDFGLLLPSTLTDTGLRKKAFKDTLSKLGDDLMRKPLTGYAPELGYESHRRAGASFVKDSGYEAPLSEIIVTDGAQEAIHLIFSILSKPSDTIMAEEVGYLGVKTASNIRNRIVAPIAMDEQGIIPESLEAVAKKTQSKLLFLVPNLQNPTGITMPLERRQAIAAIAERCDFYIIEDNPFWALAGELPPPIVSLAPERTFYITSLSKYVSPSLRIGYLRAVPKFVPDLEIAKHALSQAGSSLQAEVAKHWIKTGILYELTAWQKKEIHARWDIANTILEGHLLDDLLPKPFIWLSLPERWCVTDFISALKAENINCIDSNHFIHSRVKEPTAIRVALTTPETRKSLELGLTILKQILGSAPNISQPLY
ncbi:PLP-dependent aminotransferase family protein [Amphritea sp. 1_MG-2023]|uniref:aminotransferase-like domain-containing protein n=1 Tax=Amphritea sp. 1_MG-2023 TaxID=3062670 RepID=UPI0026E18E25|nr:PLP-dependent aminotransferase family protein [Amphritea sp. 1_MG-2023]MDO6565063.1 PLP-dependent aminotransferase family protein [Amphritea sp. 1_MG-2023]